MAQPSRVVAGIAGLTAAVVIASTVFTYWFGDLVLRIHKREALRREVIAQLDQLTSTLTDAETGQRGFIITGDEHYLQPSNDAVKRLPRDVRSLKDMESVGVTPAKARAISDLVQQKLAELHSSIELRRSGHLDAATSVIQGDSGKQIIDQLRAEVMDLKSKQSAALQLDAKLSDETTRARTLVFMLVGVFNIVFLAWAYQRIVKSVREETLPSPNRTGVAANCSSKRICSPSPSQASATASWSRTKMAGSIS